MVLAADHTPEPSHCRASGSSLRRGAGGRILGSPEARETSSRPAGARFLGIPGSGEPSGAPGGLRHPLPFGAPPTAIPERRVPRSGLSGPCAPRFSGLAARCLEWLDLRRSDIASPLPLSLCPMRHPVRSATLHRLARGGGGGAFAVGAAAFALVGAGELLHDFGVTSEEEARRAADLLQLPEQQRRELIAQAHEGAALLAQHALASARRPERFTSRSSGDVTVMAVVLVADMAAPFLAPSARARDDPMVEAPGARPSTGMIGPIARRASRVCLVAVPRRIAARQARLAAWFACVAGRPAVLRRGRRVSQRGPCVSRRGPGVSQHDPCVSQGGVRVSQGVPRVSQRGAGAARCGRGQRTSGLRRRGASPRRDAEQSSQGGQSSGRRSRRMGGHGTQGGRARCGPRHAPRAWIATRGRPSRRAPRRRVAPRSVGATCGRAAREAKSTSLTCLVSRGNQDGLAGGEGRGREEW